MRQLECVFTELRVVGLLPQPHSPAEREEELPFPMAGSVGHMAEATTSLPGTVRETELSHQV